MHTDAQRGGTSYFLSPILCFREHSPCLLFFPSSRPSFLIPVSTEGWIIIGLCELTVRPAALLPVIIRGLLVIDFFQLKVTHQPR